MNVVFFYNALNVLYSVLDEDLCTPRRCPVMCAGPQVLDQLCLHPVSCLAPVLTGPAARLT